MRNYLYKIISDVSRQFRETCGSMYFEVYGYTPFFGKDQKLNAIKCRALNGVGLAYPGLLIS